MRVLKTKPFARWARKERLDDLLLAAAVAEMRRGLVDANLGGGLLKKRQGYLAMSEETVLQALRTGQLREIDYGETQAS